MKRAVTMCVVALVGAGAAAESNVNPQHTFSWQENTGWMNWRDANDAMSGVEILPDHLRGFIWGENIGWINVGNGGGPYAPQASQTGADFGVNIDFMTGELSGYAWGENVGWINFGTTPFVGAQGAAYDFNQLRFTGYAWGENIGWVNLDDAEHFVAGNCTGDLTADGVVNGSDLAVLLAAWGSAGADLNGDGTTNGSDLAILLAAWGPC